MDTCLCDKVRRLTGNLEKDQARNFIPELNTHLKHLQAFLAQLKGLGLARDIKYAITVSNQRTSKALSMDSIDLGPVDRVCDKFRDNINGFWESSDDTVQRELRRRIACVVIFLRSKLDASASVPRDVADSFQGPQNYGDLRHAGRKYLKIARRLGGIGSLFWLPVDIPHSTYERYLQKDDQEIFNHLTSLHPQASRYSEIVRHLILSQVKKHAPSPYSYYNLSLDYGDLLTASDHISLLLYALGGQNIPDRLFRSALAPQRRWNTDGEIESTSVTKFGLPEETIHTFSDANILEQALTCPSIIKSSLRDGAIAWSLHPEFMSSVTETLESEVTIELGILALKVICFACPPCYIGDTDWSAPSKEAIWPLLDRAIKTYKIPQALRTHVLEVTLYFCERDHVAIRHPALEQSRSLLRKSMPYHFHASVILFQSILDRMDGDTVRSEMVIRDFLCKGQKPMTRRDHALRGRLHISQIDNKIKCSDGDVSDFIYNWKAEQPLSSLDVEVTSRLQGVAARFFQSVGDFGAAIDSLKQLLSLNEAKPIRANSRRLLVSRLADIYCEMQEFARPVEILGPELHSVADADRLRRPFRRLTLALVEANIGLGLWNTARSLLQELDAFLPLKPDDMYDQQLHMRRIIAEARIKHMTSTHSDEAVRLWKLALQEVEQMNALKGKGGFCAAIIYLSLAHAQLLRGGDRDGARQSWATGAEILRVERCEFWIPIASTTWLHRVVSEVHQMQGWVMQMMLPGGRPDVIWS